MAPILQSSSQFQITRTYEMKIWKAKALPCVKKTATPVSISWECSPGIPLCSPSSFLLTHFCLSHRIVVWIHLYVLVKICEDGEDTVVVLLLLSCGKRSAKDVQQNATKYAVSYHQASLLLCDFLCQWRSNSSQLLQNRINANNTSICFPFTTDKSVSVELKIDLPYHYSNKKIFYSVSIWFLTASWD